MILSLISIRLFVRLSLAMTDLPTVVRTETLETFWMWEVTGCDLCSVMEESLLRDWKYSSGASFSICFTFLLKSDAELK